MTVPAARVGLSRDFLTTEGERNFDEAAWQRLAGRTGLDLEFLQGPPASPVTAGDLERYDALIIKRNPVAASIFGPAPPRVRLIARNGVGVDHIDLAACSRAGVMVATTPDAVARPVASAVMAMILAFSHDVFARDRMARAGRWAERWNRPGIGLTGRTLGVVGLGNIGLEVLRLASPWGMQHLGATPHPDPARYTDLRVTTVPLEPLLARSDFVALCCPLNDATRGMIDARALASMQPHAYLINTARGEVVEEAALVEALRERRIAGAGIDVYEHEPPRNDHPLFALDNVILGSHNLAYTDEMNRRSNHGVVDAVSSFLDGNVPVHIVNKAVLASPGWRGSARRTQLR